MRRHQRCEKEGEGGESEKREEREEREGAMRKG